MNKKEFATLRAKTYSNLTESNKKKKSHNHKQKKKENLIWMIINSASKQPDLKIK